MKTILLFILFALILIFIYLIASELILNSKKYALKIGFNKVTRQYSRLLRLPLPQSQSQIDDRIILGQRLKRRHRALIEKAQSQNYFKRPISTKEKLIKEIDYKTGVLSDILHSEYGGPNMNRDKIKETAQKLTALEEKIKRATPHRDSLVELLREYQRINSDIKIK